MKTTFKKVLAALGAMIIFSSLTSGATYLFFNEWKAGLYYTLILYGAIALLASVGLIKMLLDYAFE